MTDRLDTEPPSSVLPKVLAGLFAVALIIALTVLVTGMLKGDDDPVDPTSSSTTATEGDPSPSDGSSSSPVSGAAGQNAAGCLGGVNPSEAVLAAQKDAPLTPQGAAAFAATVMRWRSQFPSDPDYAAKARKVMTETAGSDLLTIDPEPGGPEDSGWGTTEGARYRVSEVTKDSATVEIVMPFFGTSKEYPDGVEVETAARWRLVAVDDHWRVADMDPIDKNQGARDEVATSGLTFTRVC